MPFNSIYCQQTKKNNLEKIQPQLQIQKYSLTGVYNHPKPHCLIISNNNPLSKSQYEKIRVDCNKLATSAFYLLNLSIKCFCVSIPFTKKKFYFFILIH